MKSIIIIEKESPDRFPYSSTVTHVQIHLLGENITIGSFDNLVGKVSYAIEESEENALTPCSVNTIYVDATEDDKCGEKKTYSIKSQRKDVDDIVFDQLFEHAKYLIKKN